MSLRLGFLVPEVLGMAVSSVRSHGLRSLLTTLGVVIGVGTVVGMVSIIKGFDRSVGSSITSFGSHVIYLRKARPGTPFTPDMVDSVQRTPAFTADDAEAVRRLCPDVGAMTVMGFIDQITAEYRGHSTTGMQVLGVDPFVQEVNEYAIESGRFFTDEELRRSAQVVVLGRDVRTTLMGGVDPVGKTIHLNGVPFTVIGELVPKGRSLFFNPDEIVNVPYTTLTKYFPPPPDAMFFVPKRGEYYLNAKAVTPERTAAAIDEITEVLRRRRGLTARQRDNFAIFTEEALTKLYNQLTGAIFVVMMLISSIALIVGGIGVMNIMLVAVTERTHEIGLRKALGAPRATILLQFLFEAAMLTGIGGLIGIGFGAAVAQLVRLASGLPAFTPAWSVVVAFVFSVVVGLFFGLYPAMRASRLDPVEALRYE